MAALFARLNERFVPLFIEVTSVDGQQTWFGNALNDRKGDGNGITRRSGQSDKVRRQIRLSDTTTLSNLNDDPLKKV